MNLPRPKKLIKDDVRPKQIQTTIARQTQLNCFNALSDAVEDHVADREDQDQGDEDGLLYSGLVRRCGQGRRDQGRRCGQG